MRKLRHRAVELTKEMKLGVGWGSELGIRWGSEFIFPSGSSPSCVPLSK